MAFVHGYPRDLGWVKAHRRPPNEAEGGQLPLIVAVSPEAGVAAADVAGEADQAGVDQAGVDQVGSAPAGRSPPGGVVSSARNSAITRS